MRLYLDIFFDSTFLLFFFGAEKLHKWLYHDILILFL